jgi:hypothetical protein
VRNVFICLWVIAFDINAINNTNCFTADERQQAFQGFTLFSLLDLLGVGR